MVLVARDRLRFNVLGPLEGWSDGTRLRLGGVIQERVLGTLLLEHGRVVPVARLVQAAWPDDPPATATHQVRKAVADLRRRIPAGAEVLATDGPGYRAMLETGQLDLAEFRLWVQQAMTATAEGRPKDAAELLRKALGLRRGAVLAGHDSAVLEGAATAIEERCLFAGEKLFELRLGLGEAAELVGDLHELISRHPLRETLRGHLMLALYRSGRAAEALEEYGKVRELLADELGTDPGPALSKLHEAILRESPELDGPVPAGPPAPVPVLPTTGPSTLPYDLEDFTGREAELQQILAYARGSGERRTRVVAIDGMGGCGKTSLAVRAAHRLAPDHPDGRLHFDLRGYTPGAQPVSASVALDGLLRTLGVPGDRIPDDLPGRTALWRASLEGRRVLLLLDNAVDAEDVVPLLPNSPGCLVLVTSRARLLDLDGAEWISLGVMPPDDSAALVAETLGAQRVAAEPEAAADLARMCGHLPLALRIATARLRNRPRWTLRYLADRLRDENHRLDELSSGARSVAATLRLSYQSQTEECRAAFRTLALHPGGELDSNAAGALLGIGSRDAEDVLELLLDVHLLQQPDIGRYAFHDLVRSFAQSLLGTTADTSSDLAVERLLGYYLTATDSVCDLLFPGRPRRPTGIEPSPAELPPISDPDLAQEWFAREQTALISAVRLAERRGHHRHVVCLVRNLVFQLNAAGYLEEFAELGRLAVTSARKLDDLALLGVSLSNLGVACWKLGRFNEGIEVAREGREVAERLGDHQTRAHSDSTLGLFHSMLGAFPQALEHLDRALAHARELGSARSQAHNLTMLSTLYEQWGRYEEARRAAEEAVGLWDRTERRDNRLVALTDLAFAQVGLGDLPAAATSLAGARALLQESTDPVHVALALALSADVDYRLGRVADIPEDAHRALDLVESGVSPLRRAKVENILGRLHHRHGDMRSALRLHERAYERASAIQYRIEQAYALTGMAEAEAALGDGSAAAEKRAAAEELFARLDVPAGRRRG